jgi:CspA family cold shock protein
MQNKTGKVKWFDTTKGFGFVVDDEGGDDILLHANVLRNFGRSSVAEGTEIEIVVVASERGQQASEIVRMEHADSLPDNALRGLEEAGIDLSTLSEHSELTAARVKWFDKVKGFGFLNVFESTEDIFVHAEVLRAYGISELQQSEAVSIRTASGPRGKLAIEIRPWDFAAEHKS